ncbi:MAG: adenosylcobinamide amidohydrolase [Salinigranum sp.]
MREASRTFGDTVREGVLQVSGAGCRWLSTGFDGGFCEAEAAYNVSVPEGWSRTDLGAYVAERRERAGFPEAGPALLTGVDLAHLRGARRGSVVAYATAGVSNPAALPVDGGGAAGGDATVDAHSDAGDDPPAGTVNLIVGTTRALDDAAAATLLTVAAEAKAATLLAETGFPGTTTDAVVVGTDPAGESARFAGSGTPVGDATRACVREAVRASLDSRYDGREVPGTVAEAEYGVVTGRRADVFEP